MKKYIKPELFYERYELAQHIADCAWELKDSSGNQTYGDGGNCVAYPDQDYLWGYTETLFTSKLGCVFTPETWEDYCYQTGTTGRNTFVS